jgi:hypothetical protein
MNYYIIPKNNANINIFFSTCETIKPYISFTTILYLENINYQTTKIKREMENIDKNTLENISKIINPLEFIHTIVPGQCLSVSKVKASNNIFFELLEIFHLCNLTEILSYKVTCTIGNIANNMDDTKYLINMIRDENDDKLININIKDFIDENYILDKTDKFDLLLFEFSEKDYNNIYYYTLYMIKILNFIVNNQTNYGITIIKMDSINYKPILDIVYILSVIYDKIYLIKPNICNITSSNRYLICRQFNKDIVIKNDLINQLKINIQNYDKKYITSIITNNIPYYFLNKIEELNVLIGQQQLESYDQIINIIRNKNRDDKLEVLKKNHIQKCIQWCEKNQLPHNKFLDKNNNIFLHSFL